MTKATIPREYKNLELLLKEIITGIDNDFVDYVKSSHLKPLESWAWGWNPILKYVCTKEIDRCGDVLYGPIYTSNYYEWPVHNDYPMIPVIQLDLDHCKEVSGFDLGSGLLQVWNGHKQKLQDSMIRIIPKNEVNQADALAVPHIDCSIETVIDFDWIYDVVEGFDNSESAIQICGYKKKRFTSQLTQGFKDCYGRIKDLTANEDILRKIIEFDTILKENSKNWSPSSCHLFGTFYEIQYSDNERGTPLFCFDGNYGVDWGDFGNAQLFFAKDEAGKVTFYMDWSCY